MIEFMYPWQQTLLDAYSLPAELLTEKISIAERAITKRLNEASLPDAR